MSFKTIIKSGLVSGARLFRPVVQRLTGDHAIIFMLHRFADSPLGSRGHSAELLARCLEELRREGCQLVTADEIVEAAQAGTPLRRAVAFTVDDGYLDQAEIGGEVLARYDCPATFFLVTDFAAGRSWPNDAKIAYIFQNTSHRTILVPGTSNAVDISTLTARRRACRALTWQMKSQPLATVAAAIAELARNAEVSLPAEPPPEYRPLDWDTARRLEAEGHRIGAHSCRHPTLSAEDLQTADREIAGSREAVAAQVTRPSQLFCYPTGRADDFCPRDENLCREAGFMGALSAVPGYFGPNHGNYYAIPRFSFPSTLTDFRQSLLHVEYFKDQLRRLRGAGNGKQYQPL